MGVNSILIQHNILMFQKKFMNLLSGGIRFLTNTLKDRKGRKLIIPEIENIISTINAIAFTIEQMKIIDNLTNNWI